MGGRLRLAEHHGGARRPRDALRRNKKADAAFAALDGRNRYAIFYQVNDAKKPETRARRIAKFVTMLSEGRKPYP